MPSSLSYFVNVTGRPLLFTTTGAGWHFLLFLNSTVPTPPPFSRWCQSAEYESGNKLKSSESSVSSVSQTLQTKWNEEEQGNWNRDEHTARYYTRIEIEQRSTRCSSSTTRLWRRRKGRGRNGRPSTERREFYRPGKKDDDCDDSSSGHGFN